MKALIIDNEQGIREVLGKMLQTYCPQITALQLAENIENGKKAINSFQPDILFLDVELDEGTGMDLLLSLDKITFQLIFITAHDKYAINAFKFSAIDFLLKPIDVEELQNSVEKAINNIKKGELINQLNVFKETINNKSYSEKRIVLRDSESIHFVSISDIIRCEADGAYTKVITNTKPILVSNSLKEYDEMLSPYGFIRVHHSHLINSKKIIRFDKVDGGYLIMENNDNVSVSKRKKEEIMSFINSL